MIDIKQRKSNNLSVVELFCGAGIGGMGFKKAGFNIILGIDNTQFAVDTYNLNIGNHAICENLKKYDLNLLPYADLYVGGFPCQPFSLGGTGKGEQDKEKGELGQVFFEAVKLKQPKAFFIENVNGLVSPKHKPFFERLITSFQDNNYNVYVKTTDCFEYGVPQVRKRVFVIGIRKDIKKEFSFPEVLDLADRTTLFDAIGDLPQPEEDHNIKNHKWHYEGGFSPRYLSRNRQRQWNEPSFTICSTARQLPLYPEPANYDIRKMDSYNCNPPRRFTVRECLRIQTVPDEFYFKDDIKPEKQHVRCSGIPSLISYLFSIEIEKTLI